MDALLMDCLVDTSVWIDFLNGRATPEVASLKSLLLSGRVATTPVIVMEILQGLRHDRDCHKVYRQTSLLSHYPIADERYIEAADLYRGLRKNGVTIRKSVDSLISAIAIHFSLPVLHSDRDFSSIASHSDLIIYSPDTH